jgi:peptidoglycan/LPS O-acetylase OafA/YrhL
VSENRPDISRQSSPPPAVEAGARLAWLDALRGIGAMAVVGEHMVPWLVPSLRPHWFHLGIYGVLLFFLVSGYIIPASLERRGDVRAFWISRLFRLYPLYLAVIVWVLVVGLWYPVRPQVPRDLSGVAAHLTMLLDVVHVGGVADPMWTLSYEMVFYLLVTALFVAGLHHRSASIAVGFGVAAVAAGLVLTAPFLPGPWPAIASAVVFTAGMACVLTGRYRVAAAYVLGGMALVLLMLGSFVPWLGGAIVAVMFAGTAIYRWEHRTGRLWPLAVVGSLVAIAPLWADEANWWWVQPRIWLTTLVLVAATFALGLVFRRRPVPRPLVWLGLISYSVYLLHHPLLRYLVAVIGDVRWKPLTEQVPLAVAYVAAMLALSWLTYRYVERPMQALGRRVSRRTRGRDHGRATGSGGVPEPVGT